MLCKKIILSFFIFILFGEVTAQNDTIVFAKYTTRAARTKLYQNLIKNSINKNLSLTLNDSTEDNWRQAFSTMETLGYKSPWINNRVQTAFDSIQKRSINFQKALLEFIYASYITEFQRDISGLLETNDPQLFALCNEYLYRISPLESFKRLTNEIIKNRFGEQLKNPVIKGLQNSLQPVKHISADKILPQLFKKDFLEGSIIMYSLQRKNRNYPGLAIVKKIDGSFALDSNGKIFYIPQLARSITNLPYYLSNGNTPQGIFRMFGFDVSKSNFIGPTTNIQLTMPVETSIRHFLNDTTITDTIWTINIYKKLLPEKLKNFMPLYESYYAGESGRTEIIAHGSTINPHYYNNKPWYPLTPSLGCLCTMEEWDEQTGKRLRSDQQNLVNVLQTAGGANGYCVVIEIDDRELPVNINEIIPFIPR